MDDATTINLVIAVVAVIGPIVTAVVVRRSVTTSTSTASSDTTTTAVTTDIDTLVELAVGGLRGEVATLRERVDTQADEIADLRLESQRKDDVIAELQSEVTVLHNWVRAQGADPTLIAQGIADAWVAPDPDDRR